MTTPRHQSPRWRTLRQFPIELGAATSDDIDEPGDAREVDGVQFPRFAIEQTLHAIDSVCESPRSAHTLTSDVTGDDFQIVQTSEQILESLEPVHQPERRHTADLMDQLEDVAKPLGGDSNQVQPIEGVQRAGGLDRGFQTVGPALQAPPQEDGT
jgi:hypothetical protein